MKKISHGWFKWVMIGLYIFAAGASVFGLIQTKINYDLSLYLPQDSLTKQSLVIYEEQFGLTSTIQVMAEEVSIQEAKILKSRLQAIDEVAMVVWLDDVVDLQMPLESYDQETIKSYYHDEKALYLVSFNSGDYDPETEQGIKNIRNLLKEFSQGYLRGEPINNMETRLLTMKEIGKIILIVLPVAILILILASSSWIEPLLILISLGVAVLFNLGTNFIFPSVSFITFSISAILQLAISLDYSLFLIHRYYEEKDLGKDLISAITTALKAAFGSISASALTTIAGFLALLFMRYTIGFDIGLVMAKGVVFSYISCLTLLPILIVLFAPLLDKTRHRKLLPSFEKASKVMFKGRKVAIWALIVFAVGGAIFQTQTNYYYGNNQAAMKEGSIAEERSKINEVFGEWNMIVILVPNTSSLQEKTLINELSALDNVISVQGIYAFIEQSTPITLLPEPLRQQFQTEDYSQIIVNTDLVEENQTLYTFSQTLESLVKSHYDDYYLMGSLTSTTDIRQAVKNDSLIVSLVSIGAVYLILLILFRQLTLPIILISVIQTSIWINFAIPFFQGVSLAYLGFLVVSSLQLGATIDYAVLLGSRYQEFRKDINPHEAMKKAVMTSSNSILVSTLILTAAGIVLGMFSSLGAIKEMGILIGRGAALSGGLVLLLLGPMLVMLDRFIVKKPRQRKEKL